MEVILAPKGRKGVIEVVERGSRDNRVGKLRKDSRGVQSNGVIAGK